MKIIDRVDGKKHDIWMSEINVKTDSNAAKKLLKKFKNPQEKTK